MSLSEKSVPLDAVFRDPAESRSDSRRLGTYEKPSGYFSCSRSELVTLVPANARRILDVGCGEGGFGKSLKVARPLIKPEIVGVELTESAAKVAATVLDEVIVGNIEQIDLPYESYFDCVVFADVLEHLVDPWNMLRRARRFLKPNGTIVCSIPNVQHWRVVRSLLRGEWKYDEYGIMDSTHLRFFTAKSIGELLSSTQFRIRELSPILLTWAPRLLARVTLGRAAPFLTAQFLVVAERDDL